MHKFLFIFGLLILILSPLTSNANPSPNREWPLKMIDARKNDLSLQSTKPIVVAIIDTGIDKNHRFLESMLWTNPGESGLDAQGRDKSTNGIDDDGNGFIDDAHGWNFVHANADVTDHHGHGTHVAGIIAAVSAGEFPPKEVNKNVEFMVLKYYDNNSSPLATMKNTVDAINYAVKNGAHIINYSGGGLSPNAQEKAALKRAEQAGVLIVAAAGNEASNSDYTGYYPANYDLNNILSVGSVNENLNLVESSNYGTKNVDLMAPGEDIPSSLPGASYGLMTGTSQATAFATAAAALLLVERNGALTPEQIIQHLIVTGRYAPSLEQKSASSSVLNIRRSLKIALSGEMIHSYRVNNYRVAMEEALLELLETKSLKPLKSLDWTQTLLQNLF